MARKRKEEKYEKKRCVIGIDESYTRTGITIAVDGEIKKISSVSFKNIKTKTAKRNELRRILKKALSVCVSKYGEDVAVIFERIRTYTQTTVLSMGYVKSTAALCAVIVDCASEFGIESWSVDTRAWKSSILGTSKPCAKVYPGVKDPKKILDVEYIVNLGFGKEISIYKGRNKKQFVCYNDDAADSACIALYGFVEEPKLKKEM